MTKKQAKKTGQHIRKRLAPAKLKELIELVNLLPPFGEFEPDPLPSARSIVEAVSESGRSIEEVFSERTSELPQRLKQYIGKFPTMDGKNRDEWVDVQEQQHQVLDRYDYVAQGREILVWLAKKKRPSALRFPQLAPRVGYDDKGRVMQTPSPLMECILGAEAQRINRCPICEKIYWAERADQPTCSKQHNAVRWSRIQRGTYQSPLEQKGK